MYDAMRQALCACDVKYSVGVAFSGGVDSAALARLCHMCDCDITLLTVGFDNSHDVEYSKKVSSILKLPHHIHVIQRDEFDHIRSIIHDKIGKKSLSWHENCIAFYFVSKLAKKYNLNAIITANGVDELYCGYDVYRRIYDRGTDAILSVMHDKISNEVAMLHIISKICNITMHHPFLSQDFIDYSFTIPLYDKIRGTDDYTRKHAIRAAAEQMGLPHDVCYKRKKALQYGTRIHHHMIS